MANARDLAEVVYEAPHDMPAALQHSIEQAEAVARDWFDAEGIDLSDDSACHALMALTNMLAATEAHARGVEDDEEGVFQAERVMRLAVWHVAARRWLETVDGVQT